MAVTLSSQRIAKAVSKKFNPAPPLDHGQAKVCATPNLIWIGGKHRNVEAAKALRDWLNKVIPSQSDASAKP